MADELARGDAQACDALVTAATEDQSAPFAPDVVRDLAALKRADHFRFETLRVRLKRAGCRVGALDSLIAAASGDRGDGRQPSQADNMVGLAEAADLFQTPDEIAYADIDVDGHRETWPIKSSGLRRWLKRLYFEEFAGAPNNEAVAAALGVIEAKAQHDTPVREVFIRVGGLDGKVYLDLGDPEWQAVEIDKAGWRVIDRPAVRFRRAPDMRPLPVPVHGGSIKGLRPLLNIGEGDDGDDDFILAVAFALACLRPRGPYPVEAIGGEQGTAKSTRSAMLRMLIDPRHPKLRALPRNERDLMVTARNQHVLAFDNVSGLPMWLSDALCRLSSGAGYGTRELYTDDEEKVFAGARPIIVNGIEEVVERPDLAERSAFATCEPIDPKTRKSEEEIWASFDKAHASILGALLDAVATGLRNFSKIRPPDLPRMADFAHWVIACEPALWREGAFLKAYNANILGAVESVLEAIPIAVAVRKLMRDNDEWTGTASLLLEVLTDLAGERAAKAEEWPMNGRALSGKLRRASSFLRRVGINIHFGLEGHMRTRTITITKPAAEPETHASNPRAAAAKTNVARTGVGAGFETEL
jgi:hypothetical protein